MLPRARFSRRDPSLETTSGTIGKVVDNRRILELPLNTRNVYSLIFLTPGVAGSIGNNYNSLSYTVNGAQYSGLGSYAVRISNSSGSVTSAPAILTFLTVADPVFSPVGRSYSTPQNVAITCATELLSSGTRSRISRIVCCSTNSGFSILSSAAPVLARKTREILAHNPILYTRS